MFMCVFVWAKCADVSEEKVEGISGGGRLGSSQLGIKVERQAGGCLSILLFLVSPLHTTHIVLSEVANKRTQQWNGIGNRRR